MVPYKASIEYISQQSVISRCLMDSSADVSREIYSWDSVPYSELQRVIIRSSVNRYSGDNRSSEVE